MSFTHVFRPGASGWTLLLLHGTGGDETQLVGLGEALAPDAALLSPLGKVREGSAPRWFRRLAEGVFDHEDLVARTHELADWLPVAQAEHGFDPARLVAVGYSNGATTAGAMMLLRPGVLRGAFLLRPSVPFVPAEPVELGGTSVLLAGGRRDTVVAPRLTDEMAALLQGSGADVTVAWAEGGHEILPSDLAAGRSWLNALVTG